MCRTALEDLTPVERQALELDEALVCAASGLGAFDLATGVVLARMFDRDLLGQLNCAREADYARERLGMPPSTMFQHVKLARELRHRPVLRQAVTAGLVSTRKALAVLPLAVGDYEGAWTEAAMRLSLREIAGAAKAAGHEDPEERFEAEVVVLPMTPGQQARLDAALAHAEIQIGPEAKRWQCVEAICMEYLSSFAEYDGGGVRGPPEGPPPMTPREAKVVARYLTGFEEALKAIRGILEEHAGDDALSHDACARRLLAARRSQDEAFGILAERARSLRIHETLRYGTFEEYCEDRLGMGAGTVRQRIWLEGRMKGLPSLREALSSGRLPFSKAVVVARHATPFDVDARIEYARSTTCQQLEREAQAEEDRRNRGAGVKKLWSPGDAAATVRDAIAAAQAKTLAEKGVAIDAGEALALVADHFVKVCEDHMPENDARRWLSRFRSAALVRKGGLCAVPGCTRAAVHVHHLVFRSRGGKDDPENGVALCAFHHLRGIHTGHLEVTGRAGEKLYWKFGTGEAVPLEEWITWGDDDVRRADFAARGWPGAGAAGNVEPDGEAGTARTPGAGSVGSAPDSPGRRAADGNVESGGADGPSPRGEGDEGAGFVAEGCVGDAGADDRWILTDTASRRRLAG